MKEWTNEQKIKIQINRNKDLMKIFWLDLSIKVAIAMPTEILKGEGAESHSHILSSDVKPIGGDDPTYVGQTGMQTSVTDNSVQSIAMQL